MRYYAPRVKNSKSTAAFLLTVENYFDRKAKIRLLLAIQQSSGLCHMAIVTSYTTYSWLNRPALSNIARKSNKLMKFEEMVIK